MINLYFISVAIAVILLYHHVRYRDNDFDFVMKMMCLSFIPVMNLLVIYDLWRQK